MTWAAMRLIAQRRSRGGEPSGKRRASQTTSGVAAVHSQKVSRYSSHILRANSGPRKSALITQAWKDR